MKRKVYIVESLKMRELACQTDISKFYKVKFEKLVELSK